MLRFPAKDLLDVEADQGRGGGRAREAAAFKGIAIARGLMRGAAGRDILVVEVRSGIGIVNVPVVPDLPVISNFSKLPSSVGCRPIFRDRRDDSGRGPSAHRHDSPTKSRSSCDEDDDALEIRSSMSESEKERIEIEKRKRRINRTKRMVSWESFFVTFLKGLEWYPRAYQRKD
ncbi:unnamed protein product [Heligmosomoides polygyrus]|uniref:Uncharacterized protein n=1 Tax=Heligmosomoides polygyrus TaxID=6339 RepID=A0A183GX16_HELPZ|nr:unnamed protein product [Heligmosomoides polygyrus]